MGRRGISTPIWAMVGVLSVGCLGQISDPGQGGAGGTLPGGPAAGNGVGSNGATAGLDTGASGTSPASGNASVATTDAASNAATADAATTDAATTDAVSASTDAATSSSGMPMPCGDGTCDGATEDCATCASDCGACPTCQGAGDPTTALDAEETAFLGLLNAYRADNGLGAVSSCTSLARAAQGHSEDMRDQDYFNHTSLDGRSPWQRACDACFGLACGGLMTQMAENIAAGNAGAQATFDQWRNSAGHNANMLGASFTRIGIGRASGGGQYGVYWTNVFAADGEPSCN